MDWFWLSIQVVKKKPQTHVQTLKSRSWILFLRNLSEMVEALRFEAQCSLCKEWLFRAAQPEVALGVLGGLIGKDDLQVFQIKCYSTLSVCQKPFSR